MEYRDYSDKNRQNSPLLRTKDSFFIDTSYILEKEVLDEHLTRLKKN